MFKSKKQRKKTLIYEIWKRLKRNRMAVIGLITMLLVIIIAILAPLLIPYDYAAQNYEDTFVFPNTQHLFGTDNFGRDIFSRILYGSRYTLIIGIGFISVASLVGIMLGSFAAYFNKVDNLIMRTIDVVMGIPNFMLAISIIVALGNNMKNMMIALIITSVPAFARVARAQVLTIKEQEFIEAARSLGASDLRILVRHILPNAISPLIVQYTLGVGNVILYAASLSFIGLGIKAPTPEWGLMISEGRTYLRDYWYISIFPGLAIICTTYALNMLGDGLRDAIDPRLK
ncbi:MAG: ABC transporter permease [Lachnotalea sp.]